MEEKASNEKMFFNGEKHQIKIHVIYLINRHMNRRFQVTFIKRTLGISLTHRRTVCISCTEII